MRNFIIGVLLTLVVFLTLGYCGERREQREVVHRSSELIHQQIANVSKLIVSEGTFAQVYTYKDSKIFWTDMFSSTKSAIVLINAKVTVAYDLQQLTTEMDEDSKTITIIHIPKPEVAIHPDLEFYDIQNGYLNSFKAEDYNKIKEKVGDLLDEKIKASSMLENAQNRLISELQKIYILTHSLGWILKYEDVVIESAEDVTQLKF
jgi:hypothetical protein